MNNFGKFFLLTIGTFMSLGWVGVWADTSAVPTEAEIIEPYIKAAEGGDTEAMRKLGELYFDGKKIKVDYKKSFGWYLKAAEKGDAEAMNSVGWCYEINPGGIFDFADSEMALDWYLKSAQSGSTNGMYSVANWYSGDFNFEKAFEWCMKAAEGGSAPAMADIASFFYKSGNGVGKDTVKAEEWGKKIF